jgi:NAD(P)-dependent dehydrogenase (short-subunit alcohol dehydrogenase family)
MKLPWKVVWITGASSGIGAEIAKQLAEAGVKVAASARRFPELPVHPNITQFTVDVTDEPALSVAVDEIERRLGPIDLAIFGAGAYEPFKLQTFNTQTFRRINEVNYLGSIRALGAVLPRFMVRKSGHVAFVASVAGYQGLPKSAYYGPTKAALINLAEALWLELRPHGINVSMINPGFVETPMTAANDFPMPFLMKPARAAALTIRGLKVRRFEIAYPLPFVLILKTLQKLPQGLKLRLISLLTV